jgi:hypothetical protein
MKSNLKTINLFFTSSIIMSGILAPINIMFYSRLIFEPMNTFDYIFLIVSFFILIFVSHFLVKHILVSLVAGWTCQIIGNILLGMVLSINPEEISSSLKYNFNLFGTTFTFAAITIPLVMYLYSGLLILGCGFQYQYNNRQSHETGCVPRSFHVIIAMGLSFTINGLLLFINGATTYNIFLVSPVASIMGIYSIFMIIKKDDKVSITSDIKNKAEMSRNTISIPSIFLKGLVLFLFSVLSVLLIGFSNLALYSNIIIQYKQIYFSSTILITALFLMVFLSIKRILHTKFKNESSSKIIRLLTSDLFILSIISIIVINIIGLNAFSPDWEFNLVFQLIGNAFLLGFLIYAGCRIMQEYIDIPGSFALLYGFLIYATGYFSRIPLRTDEMWNQWDLYGALLLVIAIIFPICVLIITNFTNRYSREIVGMEGK